VRNEGDKKIYRSLYVGTEMASSVPFRFAIFLAIVHVSVYLHSYAET
jgi:hypothetical protein